MPSRKTSGRDVRVRLLAGGATTDSTTWASETGVKIDRTAPVVTRAPTTPSNDERWYRGDVKEIRYRDRQTYFANVGPR